MNGMGCPYCSGHQLLQGFNTFGDKYPHLIKYFKDLEQAFEFSYMSNKNVTLKCPYCGYEKEMIISNFAQRQRFQCDLCDDGVSSGNKLIRNILYYKKDILDYYEYEYYPKWENKKYKYDIYFIFKGKKFIGECQGIQHLSQKWAGKFINSKENDKNKKELA